MYGSALSFAARDWMIPSAVLVGLASIILFWSYRGHAAPPRLRLLCLGLKALGLVLLGAILLEPILNQQRASPGENFFVLMADNSQGMQIKDRSDRRSRGENLKNLVTEKSSWQEAMADHFQLRRYLFDSQVHLSRDFSELNFEGTSTALATGLKSVADRYRKQPLAGILLFTDGNATDLTADASFAGLPPIYPVLIGKDQPARDISIGKIQVSQTAFEDAPVTLQVEIPVIGYAGETVVVEVTDASRLAADRPVKAVNQGELKKEVTTPGPKTGTVLGRQARRVSKSSETLHLRFEIKPEAGGLQFFQVKAALEGRGKAVVSAQNEEATEANNLRMVVVDRGSGPYRILYVGGRPNWEFKFLNRALSEDPDIEMVALIRIARREPKFEFRGRAGESSNPLFRGFGNTGEETERYDKPVLVRLNMKDELELKGGFPTTAEELYRFHAVILDDVEKDFFTHDQMLLLQKFVSERGGGFLMLGGAESFQEGRYHRTPVGDMLPVYLDRHPPAGGTTLGKLSLTRDGWLQPWVRLRATEPEEKERIAEMPGFYVWNKVAELKPGALKLAEISDKTHGTLPALAAQRFGAGRTAALMVGDLWRWGLQDPAYPKDLFKSWRQLARWMVVDAPPKVEVQLANKPGNMVELQIRAKDQSFQPLENGTVKVLVDPATGEIGGGSSTNLSLSSVELVAEAATGEAGLYTATFAARDTRAYRGKVRVASVQGLDEGTVQAGWHRNSAEEEFRTLAPNQALLELIARQTGGKMVAMSDLAAFANELPRKKAPVMEAWSQSLWHQPSVFLLALACFALEWGLRRSRGLA